MVICSYSTDVMETTPICAEILHSLVQDSYSSGASSSNGSSSSSGRAAMRFNAARIGPEVNPARRSFR
jgi:hypothetical protein